METELLRFKERASGKVPHGNADSTLPIALKDLFGKAPGFWTKNHHIAMAVLNFRMSPLALGGGIVEIVSHQLLPHFLYTVMDPQIQQVPVI